MISVLITGCPKNINDELLDCFFFEKGETKLVLLGTDTIQSTNRENIIIIKAVPNSDSESYLELINGIIKKYLITDIIPLIDSEVLFLSNNREQFSSRGIRLWISRSGNLNEIINKELCYRLTTDESPKSALISNVDEIDNLLSEFGYPENPVVVRPSSGPNGSGKGFRIIVKEYDLCYEMFYRSLPSRRIAKEHLKQVMNNGNVYALPPLLLSEYLPGEEYSCYVLADRGIMLKCGIHLKLSYQGGTTNTGTAVFVQNEQIEKFCRLICQKLNLDLLNNIQVKLNFLEEPKLIEVNPRIAGTILLSEKSGLRLIKSCFNLLTKKNIGNEMANKDCINYSIQRKEVEYYQDSLLTQLNYLLLCESDQYRIGYQGSDLLNCISQKYDNIIFDLDNTILDEFHFLNESIIELARQKGFDNKELKNISTNFIKYYSEFGNYLIFDCFLENYFQKNEIKDFLQILREDRNPMKVKFLPVMESLIKHLKLMNKSIFILTDGNVEQQKLKMSVSNLYQYFDADRVFYANEKGGKPNMKCRDFFDSSSLKDCVLIGDALVDLEMAKILLIDYIKVG